MDVKIAPSLLSADFARLQEEILNLKEWGADYLHIDVMDGRFVPNITLGPLVVKAIRTHCPLLFDVHLMIENPDFYLGKFVEAGADLITVHAEACTHLHRTLQQIHALGVKSSVALNPHSPLQLIENVLEEVDMVLVMTVNPGFGGQIFIDAMLSKIEKARKMLDQKGLFHVDLEVDGGINRQTVERVRNAGANVLVAGNAVFTADNRKEEIRFLRGK